MNKLRFFIIFFVFAKLTAIINAADSSSAQFLKMGAGARAAAMGDAFTAISDDVTAAYWNPAGLVQIKTVQVSLMQNSSLLGSNYQYAGAAFPSVNHTVALSLYRIDYGSIERYNAGDVRDGSFNAGSLAAAISVGTKLSDELSWGLSGKLIQESIDTEKASGFAGDLGLLYRSEDTSYGIAAQHLGTGLKFVQDRTNLPMTIRGGVSRNFFDKKLQADIDLCKPNDDNTSLHAGTEYRVTPAFALRGGYQMTPGHSAGLGGVTGVSGGFGLIFRSFTFDYAFVPFGDLGSTQRLSVLIRFDSLR